MPTDTLSASYQTILNTGVVGAVALLAIAAVVLISRMRDAENKDHLMKLEKALVEKDKKLEVVLENIAMKCTEAMNNIADALRDHGKTIDQMKSEVTDLKRRSGASGE